MKAAYRVVKLAVFASLIFLMRVPSPFWAHSNLTLYIKSWGFVPLLFLYSPNFSSSLILREILLGKTRLPNPLHSLERLQSGSFFTFLGNLISKQGQNDVLLAQVSGLGKVLSILSPLIYTNQLSEVLFSGKTYWVETSFVFMTELLYLSILGATTLYFA